MHVKSIYTPQWHGKCSAAAERSKAEPRGSPPAAANKMLSWKKAHKQEKEAEGHPWREVRDYSRLHRRGTQPCDEGDAETSVPRCYRTYKPIGGKGCS